MCIRSKKIMDGKIIWEDISSMGVFGGDVAVWVMVKKIKIKRERAVKVFGVFGIGI